IPPGRMDAEVNDANARKRARKKNGEGHYCRARIIPQSSMVGGQVASPELARNPPPRRAKTLAPLRTSFQPMRNRGDLRRRCTCIAGTSLGERIITFVVNR